MRRVMTSFKFDVFYLLAFYSLKEADKSAKSTSSDVKLWVYIFITANIIMWLLLRELIYFLLCTSISCLIKNNYEQCVVACAYSPYTFWGERWEDHLTPYVCLKT
jgi:hypothetical protein